MRTVCENIACLKRLEKQKLFLRSKGKDMVCRGLKTINELDEAEEKEKQIESKQAATAPMLSNNPRLNVLAPRAKNDPFANLKVPLLPPEI
jgi:hypothetical protein